jgi:NAD(P)-dependent dehydrogenase (short-subunit alcohol dehydrogenase family)
MPNKENSPYSLEGKQAFVTGASKGLGEQISLGLLKQGVHVIGNSRSGPPESFKPFIDQGQAFYEMGDLAQDNKQILEDIHSKHGGYEILVNNAGGFSPDYFMRLDPEIIAREISLDLVVPLLLHRQWFELYNKLHPDVKVPELSVNICSISSFYAWPGGTAYQAAKTGLSASLSGLRSMQKYLEERASEETKQKIGPVAQIQPRIVAIYPDNVATGLIARAQQDSLYVVEGDSLPMEMVTDTILKAIEGKGNFGKFDDIAILVNPKDPQTQSVLKGVYLAFIPPDNETHRPDFKARTLEKIADEDVLIKKAV